MYLLVTVSFRVLLFHHFGFLVSEFRNLWASLHIDHGISDESKRMDFARGCLTNGEEKYSAGAGKKGVSGSR